jgi:gliding motility-associated-like protein
VEINLLNPTMLKRICFLAFCIAASFNTITGQVLITTICGDGTSGTTPDGYTATGAWITSPNCAFKGNDGNVYFIDYGNNLVRIITPGGVLKTIAGNGSDGYTGDGGLAVNASLHSPNALTIDNAGNIYFIDQFRSVIRKIDAVTGIITTIAGSAGYGYGGDGGPLALAKFGDMTDLDFDNAGNLYITCYADGTIRKVTMATGIITTIAGHPTDPGFGGDNGPATAAWMLAWQIDIDNAGNIYIADLDNQRVRKITAATGIISTIAGTGVENYTGDGGPATAATLRWPYSVAVDNAGNVYVADYFNTSVVRKIDPAGIITTFAGTGTPGYNGDDIPPATAQLNGGDISVDNDGVLYISDFNNFRIRKIYCRNPEITRQPGETTICTGGNTQFSIAANYTAGYQWQVNTGTGWTDITNSALYAGVTTPTLTLTGATTGMNNYQYRCHTTNSCSDLFSLPGTLHVAASSATITILRQPNTDLSTCANFSLSFSIGASNVTGYQWQVNTGAGWTDIANTAPYSGATTEILIITNAPGTMNNYQYRCRTSNLCSQLLSDIGTLHILPTVATSVTITASATTVCAGNFITFTPHAVNGEASTYSWYRNNVLVLGNQTDIYSAVLNNGDVVRCEIFSRTKCANPYTAVSNNIVVTVTPAPPAANISITASSTDICMGTPVTFTAAVTNSGTAPVYQWKKNGINAGTNSNTYVDNALKQGDYITCDFTSTTPCRTTRVTSNGITMWVNSSSASIVAVSGCVSDNGTSPIPGFPWPGGFQGTFTAIPSNGGTAPSYQWKLNGINVGGNSATYTNGSLSDGDVITCVLTSNSPCATATTATANFTVNTFAAAPTISVATASANICAGTASFTATVNTGGSAFFQWKKNGVNVGLNSNIYTDNTLNDGDKISCVLFSYASCSPVIVSSNTYTVACGGCAPPAIITITGNGNPGFSADGTPANTGATNNPQKLIIGKNGNIYFADYGNKRIRMIDAAGNLVTIAGGGTGGEGPATSAYLYGPAYLTMDNAGAIYFVDDVLSSLRLRKIDAAGNLVYINNSGGFSYSGDGGPLNQAGFGRIVDVAIDNAGNLYICDGALAWTNAIRKVNAATGIITTFAGTGYAGNTGDGGPATAARINNPVSPVFDNAGNLYFISGNTIRKTDPSGIITTIAGNGDAANYGDGGPAIAAAMNIPIDLAIDKDGNLYVSTFYDGIIRKITTDGIIDYYATMPADPRRVIGNYKVMDDNGNLYYTDPSNNSIRKIPCPIAACNRPQFQWQVNTGTGWTDISNNATYSGATKSVLTVTGATTVMNNYKYRCRIYNQCHTGYSDPATLFVRATTEMNYLGITSPINPVCAGSRTVFTATPTYTVPSPVYQWTKNSVNVGTNSTRYEDRTLVAGDIIQCVMTSTGGCVTNPVVTSNIIPMGVDPKATPSIIISAAATTICAGSPVTFTAAVTDGGSIPLLQWQKNGLNVSTNTTYTDNALNNGDVIRCILTSNIACALTPQVFSNNITMTVNAAPIGTTPTISVAPSANTICAGTNVTFTATITNGGPGPVYQWKKNGVNVGANSATYADNTLAQGDIITCGLTSNATCLTTYNASSNNVVMVVNPVFTPAISITGSVNNVCAGTNVTFTASGTNTGAAPFYQWKKNGTNVGTNMITYSDNNLNNGDIISCVLTSNAGCVTTTTATSNTVTMIINAIQVPAVSIAGSANNICAGILVTFTATGTNGGAAPVYQWKKNGVNVGTNGSAYTYNTVANGDIITCSITSNASCLVTPTANSNPVTMTLHANPVVTLDQTTTICEGSTRILDAGSYAGYVWNDGSTNRTLSVTNTGIYSVTVTDNNGCRGNGSTTISTLFLHPDGFLAGDTSFCNNASLVLRPTATYNSYLWSTGSTDAAITVKQAGNYSLEVTDANNCKGTNTIIVSVKQCLKGLFVPNSFTPNNNGKNDIFKPVLLGVVKLYQVQIYNRWGNLVFQSNDPQRGWDGNYRGQPSGNETFVWMIKYQLDGEAAKVEKGTVTLIR